MINFNRPVVTGRENKYISQTIKDRELCGDKAFTKKCSNWFEMSLPCKRALLTTSCTHALEMAAILTDIKEGDEVIMPSYTFVSTANAFALRGAKIIFVDIRPDTMNIDEKKIEMAITKKTKVIVPVHYAGVSCEMDIIMDIANRNNLLVVEDAAQGFQSYYKGKALGTIGHLGSYSFHETKNITCGEGGALFINHERFIERAEIIREKGTNRTRFFRGQVDKYTWVDIGSSYLPSELNAAYLYGQLEVSNEIINNRLLTWNIYEEKLRALYEEGIIEIPHVPDQCKHNGHMFYIKTKDLNERTELIAYLKERGIQSVFHYIPLHSSPQGSLVGEFSGEDRWTSIESERLLRLPLYYNITIEDVNKVIDNIYKFYR